MLVFAIISGGWVAESPTWAPNGRVLMFFRPMQAPTGGTIGSTVEAHMNNSEIVTHAIEFDFDRFWTLAREARLELSLASFCQGVRQLFRSEGWTMPDLEGAAERVAGRAHQRGTDQSGAWGRS